MKAVVKLGVQFISQKNEASGGVKILINMR
jgi:hypothetical protein